jgi:hypothetical protein
MACALSSLGTSIYTTKGGKTKGEADQDGNGDGNSGFKLKLLED